MSPPSPLSNDSPTPSSGDTDTHQPHDRRLRDLLRTLKGPTQFVSFWAAIGLPFVLVSLLSYGLDQRSVALAFLTLLVLNVLALYVGHGYNQSRN